MEYNIDAYVYGHTARPINGLNYVDYVKHIETHHKNNVIIAVDACLGKKQDVGKIKCSLKGIAAGGALNKNYERIGDIGILGIVGEATKSDNMETLKSVNKHFISAMASSIAKIINKLVSELYDLRIYGKKAVLFFI